MSLITNIIRKIWRNVFHPTLGEIWCLHRVVPQRSLMPENRELEITPEYLEELIIKNKQSGFEFCDLDYIIQSKSLLRKWYSQGKYIHISFDDGFRDIFDYAYPILKKHHIPFTIYLTTDFPDQKAVIWWIILETILMHNEDIRLNTGEIFSCRDMQSKIDLYSVLSKRIYNSDQKPLDAFLSMFSIANITDLKRIQKEYTLTWDQILTMSTEGLCTIGSHAVSHPDLRKISDIELQYELNESKRIIEARIHKPVLHFSYPHSFWNTKIKSALLHAGFQTAAIGYDGVIRSNHDRYCLHRRYVTQL